MVCYGCLIRDEIEEGKELRETIKTWNENFLIREDTLFDNEFNTNKMILIHVHSILGYQNVR